MSEQEEPHLGWCVLELMGHLRVAGWVTEEEVFGQKMCRIDIPAEPPTTHYYGSSAIYGIHPTNEAAARTAARMGRPEPVHRWELESPSWQKPSPLGGDSSNDEDTWECVP